MSFKNRPVLALIPARGGSKGIVKKNLYPLCGKPLISYTINAALESNYIDTIYISSDDPEILALGESMGIVALRRSEEASSDHATATDVLEEFVSKVVWEYEKLDPFIVYLQPTSPLRNAHHIDSAFKELDCQDHEMALSVFSLDKSIYKSFSLDQKGLLKSIFGEELANANRQSLSNVFYPNGAIYIFPLKEYIRRKYFPADGSIPFIMSEEESIDIDSIKDIAKAEEVMGEMND